MRTPGVASSAYVKRVNGKALRRLAERLSTSDTD
jgi:hypothetical protein